MEPDNGDVSKQLSKNDDLSELDQNYRPNETQPNDNVGEESNDGSRAPNWTMLNWQKDNDSEEDAPTDDDGLDIENGPYLKNNNFALFQPKKDVCNTYESFKTGNLSNEEYEAHILRKCEARVEKDLDKETIVLYGDGCTYQNQCSNLSNALLHVASTKNARVEQKFLEVGHTHMEADAIHSRIECKLKNKNINVPIDYETISKEAHSTPVPYTVQYVDHKFVKNFDENAFYNSIRPGRGIGSSRVVDVCALKYLPDQTKQFKLNFSDEWVDLP
ncbi:hypothetical protein PR048_031218 [Dryococelus australis]|uniref:DUF7869 domain-containing protein n=1 Tax=Dryococelus australis TaxID=614101 RepID=A0ABQ9G7I8_9NEOP|nr:hypothetical protein PR048_031218 [Dryococelus australis]